MKKEGEKLKFIHNLVLIPPKALFLFLLNNAIFVPAFFDLT
jgi:hypothetical protein